MGPHNRPPLKKPSKPESDSGTRDEPDAAKFQAFSTDLFVTR